MNHKSQDMSSNPKSIFPDKGSKIETSNLLETNFLDKKKEADRNLSA